MALSKGSRRFHELLLQLHVGEIIDKARLMTATGWSEVSVSTYLNKNKLTPFLQKLPNGTFKVVRAGPALREQEVERALTQVSPTTLVLVRGDVLEGETGARYHLSRELGRGAVGHVWEAQRQADQEIVAVKVVNPRPDLLEPTRLQNITQRFRREARNGAKLVHENIVSHLDFGEISANPFLVMERASRSWADVLATEGQVDRVRATLLLRHTLTGLKYLHDAGCIHRDVKPANLLVTQRGTVVGDLGIVKWSDLNPDFTSAGTLTTSSKQLGSWHYMAPEQLAGPHEATVASDVYALGVTWHELLTRDVLTPAAFGAGKVPVLPAWPEAREMIVRMTSYDPVDRPSIAGILEFLGA